MNTRLTIPAFLAMICLATPLHAESSAAAAATQASNGAVQSAVTDARDAAMRTQRRHPQRTRWVRAYQR